MGLYSHTIDYVNVLLDGHVHNAHVRLGWTEGKKRSPIDSGILWANVDIYRSLMVERNRGPYLI